MVFFDEFNGDALDQTKWDTYYPYGPNGSDSCAFCRTHSTGDNQEGQVFLDENVRIQNGILFLDVKLDSVSWFGFEKNYTSGMIHSKQVFDTYSRYEIRCKVPTGIGYWPAFWAFGWSTEIDIFEFREDSYSCNEVNEFECNVHKWIDPHEKFHACAEGDVDLSQDFHVYAAEYNPFQICFYLDGNRVAVMPRYYTINGNAVLGCNIPPGVYIQHPAFPQKGDPLNVIANVALLNSRASLTEITPKSMEIDYIRVYQRSPQPDLVDLCSRFGLEGLSTLCFGESVKDTAMICFSGPLYETDHFSVTENLAIVENPAFDVFRRDTILLVNDVPVHSFYYDTITHLNCIRITPSSMSSSSGTAIVTLITTDERPCGQTEYKKPIKLGLPSDIGISFLPGNPCVGIAQIVFSPFTESDDVQWEIYDKGNLSGWPTLSSTFSNLAIIELPTQVEFEDSYFLLKIKVRNRCGEREFIRVVNIPNRHCGDIQYI